MAWFVNKWNYGDCYEISIYKIIQECVTILPMINNMIENVYYIHKKTIYMTEDLQ